MEAIGPSWKPSACHRPISTSPEEQRGLGQARTQIMVSEEGTPWAVVGTLCLGASDCRDRSERMCQPQEWDRGSEARVSLMPAAGRDRSIPKGSRMRPLVLSVLTSALCVCVHQCGWWCMCVSAGNTRSASVVVGPGVVELQQPHFSLAVSSGLIFY